MQFVRAHSCNLCALQFVLMQWEHLVGSLCAILQSKTECAHDFGRSGSEYETRTMSLCVHIHAVCACTFVQFVRAHSCSLCVHIGAVCADAVGALSWLIVCNSAEPS